MQRSNIVLRVRGYTRDLSNSIFRAEDIIDYINEAIDRMKEIVPEFNTLTYLLTNESEPTLLPSQYHHLLAVYSASRCFAQDERHYQATNLMNEFETKLEELYSRILQGTIVIVDAGGVPVVSATADDYVHDVYSTKTNYENMKDYFPEG